MWVLVVEVGLALGLYSLAAAYVANQWALLATAAVLCVFLAMVVGSARKVLLALILLDVPLQLDIHLAYREGVAQLGAIDGLGISITTLCLLALYGLWMSDALIRSPDRARLNWRAAWPLALYVSFAGLSILAAGDVSLAVFEVFLLIQLFLLYLYVVSTVRSRADIVFIVTALLIGLVLEALIMIGLRLVGHGFSFAGIAGRISVNGRVAGTVGSPILAASYLGLLLAPALTVLITPLGRARKEVALLAFGLGCIAMVFTFSRGAWLALAVSLLIVCWAAGRRGWLPRRIPLLLLAGLLVVAVAYAGPIFGRLLGDDNESAASRIPLMQLAARIIEDHPITGVGANNFGAVLAQYTTPEFDDAFLWAVHNKYLLVWAETGLGGLMAFLIFLALALRWGWQVWKTQDRLLAPLALGLTAAIAGQMIHMLVDVFHDRPQVETLWLAAGLLAAMHLNLRRAP
jgi:O-antigen ligase